LVTRFAHIAILGWLVAAQLLYGSRSCFGSYDARLVDVLCDQFAAQAQLLPPITRCFIVLPHFVSWFWLIGPIVREKKGRRKKKRGRREKDCRVNTA